MHYIREELKTIASFLIVGGATAVLYFSLLAIFLEVVELDYKLGVSIAYLLAVIFHFFSHRHITFRSGSVGLAPQVLRYLVIAFVSYVMTLGIVYVVVELLRYSAYIGVIVSIIATVGVGFIASKNWVFRRGGQVGR